MPSHKTIALALLAVLSFASPLIERISTGRVESFSTFAVVDTLISLVLLFWWYHVDKDERNFRASPLMNAGVLVLAIIALPVYFIRSRGWKRGAAATALATLFLGAMLLLEELGERAGALLAI